MDNVKDEKYGMALHTSLCLPSPCRKVQWTSIFQSFAHLTSRLDSFYHL